MFILFTEDDTRFDILSLYDLSDISSAHLHCARRDSHTSFPLSKQNTAVTMFVMQKYVLCL
jgi:hypothetical protein